MDADGIKLKRSQLKKTIGKQVRLARESAGFKNQDSLAEAIGISRQAVCAIEAGKSIPGSDTLYLIAEETNKPLDFFFSRGEAELSGVPERIEEKVDQILSLLQNSRIPNAE